MPPTVSVCERIRQLRETKGLSQGDIEAKTKLLRCYVSRVENGHTVPSVETLQKLANALGVPLYQLFYEPPDGTEPDFILPPKKVNELSKKKQQLLNQIVTLFRNIDDSECTKITTIARTFAKLKAK
jgi:transcriptional regulator with XRE-family HTH domain